MSLKYIIKCLKYRFPIGCWYVRRAAAGALHGLYSGRACRRQRLRQLPWFTRRNAECNEIRSILYYDVDARRFVIGLKISFRCNLKRRRCKKRYKRDVSPPRLRRIARLAANAYVISRCRYWWRGPILSWLNFYVQVWYDCSKSLSIYISIVNVCLILMKLSRLICLNLRTRDNPISRKQ